MGHRGRRRRHDVDLAVRAAREALSGPWSQVTGFGRAKLMRKVGDLIARDADYLAELETRDTGKLTREMRDQLAVIPGVVLLLRRPGRQARGQDRAAPQAADFLVYTRREPVGVVGGDHPVELAPSAAEPGSSRPAWRPGAPAWSSPATTPRSPPSTVAARRSCTRPGARRGGQRRDRLGPAMGEALAAHPGVDKIAFTGSTRIGAEVARAAAVSNIHRDRARARRQVSRRWCSPTPTWTRPANGWSQAVFAATGQTCMAGSRLLVDRRVHDRLVEKDHRPRADVSRFFEPHDAAQRQVQSAMRYPHVRSGALSTHPAGCAIR